MEIRSAYSPRKSVAIDFKDDFGEPEPSRTEQCHKKACDIHHIIKQYDRNGLVTHVNTMKAEYGDYTQVNEYQEALNMVMNAQEQFMELPSKIRKMFGNDPGEFLEFATNPENQQRLVELGLANGVEVIQDTVEASTEVITE